MTTHPMTSEESQPTTSLFDYASLDTEVRIVVQQRTREIHDDVKIIGDKIIAIGNRLLEVKDRLGHGNFGVWLRAEFQWSQDTAGQFMNVARLAAQNPRISEHAEMFGRSALVLLAAPSTPEGARDELLDRAGQGEKITHRDALEAVQHHKASVMASQPTRPAAPAGASDAPPAVPDPAPAVEPEPDASGPHVDAMRERFAAVGWLQFYRNDQGWRALSRTRRKQFTAWSQVEPFLETLERAAADDDTHWVDIPVSEGPARRARVLERKGNLVLHQAVDVFGGLIVAHAPSGAGIVRCATMEDGRTAFRRFAELDWDWTSSNDLPTTYEDRLEQIRGELIAVGIAMRVEVPGATAASDTAADAPAPVKPFEHSICACCPQRRTTRPQRSGYPPTKRSNSGQGQLRQRPKSTNRP